MFGAPDTFVGAGAALVVVNALSGVWSQLFGPAVGVRDCVCSCPKPDLKPVVRAIENCQESDSTPEVDLTPVVDAIVGLTTSPGIALWLVWLGVIAAFILGVTLGCFGSVLYLSCRWTRGGSSEPAVGSAKGYPETRVSTTARAIGNARHLVDGSPGQHVSG